MHPQAAASLALTQVTQELASEGPEAVEELKLAIEQRLVDLESFYYNNDLGPSHAAASSFLTRSVPLR